MWLNRLFYLTFLPYLYNYNVPKFVIAQFNLSFKYNIIYTICNDFVYCLLARPYFPGKSMLLCISLNL